MSNQAGYIPLVKSRVLYLGSSVPLETSIGLEAVQQPLRDRYGSGSDGFDTKVNGIDAIVTIFSSGILLEYVEDATASTWFPIQSLHVCCSVRPVRQGYGLRFVQVDSPEAEKSQEPPIFAAITRRTKGVKVLECHGFLTKTTDTALALVQCCTHAFKHKEGWLDGAPPIDRLKQTATRLIPAEQMSGRGSVRGFCGKPKQYSIASEGKHCDPPQTLVVNIPACPNPQPPPQPPAQPPPQPPAQPPAQPPPQPPAQPQLKPPIGYFANWKDSADQAVMITPGSPFFPGQAFIIEQEEMKKTKRKKKKKAKKAADQIEYLVIKKDNKTNNNNNNNNNSSALVCEDDDDDDDGDLAIIYPDDMQGDMMMMDDQQQYYDGGYYPSFDYGPDYGGGEMMMEGYDYYPEYDQGGQGGYDYYPGYQDGFYPEYGYGYGY